MVANMNQTSQKLLKFLEPFWLEQKILGNFRIVNNQQVVNNPEKSPEKKKSAKATLQLL